MFNSVLAFLLIFSFISPQLVFGQEDNQNTIIVEKIEVIEGQAEVYDLQGTLVGTLLEGTQLTVSNQEDGKVYVQWGKELAYLFEVAVKYTESIEEITNETELEVDKTLTKVIADEQVNVYVDEERSEIMFILEPNIEYFVEIYSEELYKIVIGDHVGFIDSTEVTLLDSAMDVESEDETVNEDENEQELVEEEIIAEVFEEKEEEPTVFQPIEESLEIPKSEDQQISAQQALVQEVVQSVSFAKNDKYFEPTERLSVYDNSTGSLIFVGYLNEGQSYPRVSDYGDWHQIKYGNGYGYVWKASTKPSTADGIKNMNTGLKNSSITVKATSILSVYDNSSGALVPFASLNKDVSYPIIGQTGEWYRIDIAGRIGYVYEPATIRDFKSNDKYFEPTERLSIYDNSTGSLKFVGYINEGQSYPRVSDYGDWHQIKYGNGYGYVWKASTKPSTASGIKNMNTGLKNSSITIRATSILSVYDNSSGALVPFASLNKDVSYPIIGQMGEWYKIDIAGRIGHVYEPATIRDFESNDKYFEPLDRVSIYDNSGGVLKQVGYLNEGQTYPRVRDYGDWHQIKYGNTYGYVLKSSTKPSSGSSLKNENNGSYTNSKQQFIATQNLSVYDNTSGSNVAFATILKDESYPVIGEYGPDWYRVDVAGRIGFVFKGGINKVTKYNITLQELLNKQMSVKPQTDKYRNDKSYVSASTAYIQLDKVDKTKGYVQVPTLNVREGPSTNFRLVGSLSKSKGVNDFVKILNEKDGWYEISYGAWKNSTAADTLEYLNPGNIKNDSFQYLVLSRHANTDVKDIEAELVGQGILSGRTRAEAFIKAGRTLGINEVYLISHAYLETGRGTSKLSTGIVVNGKTVYNMFGIGAVDVCPETCGAQRAYDEGWFTPEAAIIGGAKFVADKYVYSAHKQDTLYKMRWNPEWAATNLNPTHQYATDIGWASKQAGIMEGIYNRLSTYSVEFDIPKYQ